MQSDDIEDLLLEVYTSQAKQSKSLHVQMLQRQVMFRQLQDLQRRQQLQELSDNRNQNFVNQLPSLKHASLAQFSPAINGGTTLLDSSQMSVFGNMETMPGGLVLTQNHNPDAMTPVGLPPPQFDMSSYGTHATNGGKNFNQYSHLQGPSNLSVDMRTKNHKNLGVVTMQPSPFGSSFMNQQFNFPSDQIRIPDGQGPIESFNRESLSGNYSMQGIPMQGNASLLESGGGHQDADWDGFSAGQSSSNLGTASLDPLEQKILYGTDDNIWEPSLSRSSKMSTGTFQTAVEHASHMDSLPSLQSGSWSALMLSAVEETSSSEPGVQEEWSGLSVKNPGSLNGIQPPNFSEGKKLQNNWVDRNLQNVPPPSSGGPKHFFQNLNMNHSFPSFQESGHQYGSSHATLDQFSGNSGQLTDYSSQKRIPARGTQPIHAPLLSTASPDSGFRLQTTHPQAPQAYSFFPTLGSSSATFLSGNSTNDTGNQHPVLSIPSPIGTQFPASSAGATQHAGLPIPWLDVATPQNTCSHKPQKFSNLFGFPNPSSSRLEATDHPNQKSFQHEQESGPNTRRPESYEQQLKRGNSLPESSSDKNNSISLGSTHTQEYEKNHHTEAGAIGSDSVMDQQLSNQVEGDDNEVPPVDIGAFGKSQNYSLVHQVHSSRNIETDGGKSSLSKYNNVNREKSNANAVDLFMSGPKPGVKDIAKSDPNVVPQLIATSSGIIKGPSISQEAQITELGRASLAASHQKQAVMLCQNDTPVRSTGSIEAASNLAYPSQISLQNASSWIKHNETLKDGNTPPMCEPTSAFSAEQQFSELQQNSLTMQANLAQANQGSAHYPSTTATSILSKQIDSPSIVASDVMTSQKLPVSVPKKRKLTEFAMVPWHKEMSHEPSGLHDISIADLAWARVLNRRAMEVKDEADVEECLPPVRAKRRLICSTQFMQQVFGPMPVVILRSDSSSNCNLVPYLAARLTLGDASNLTSQLSDDANDVSPDKPKNSKRRKSSEFSKVVEGLINRAQKLQGVLLSVSKRPSYATLKLEAQELEKFSIINRFAKIHIKAVNSAASSPAASKTNIQRYVVAVPMPSILPEEGVDCLSL